MESSIFIHIPLYQYRTAWELAYDEETQDFRDEYKDSAFGVKHENVASPNVDNGFFDILKELDSTKTAEKVPDTQQSGTFFFSFYL